jgi:hypothetical protein
MVPFGCGCNGHDLHVILHNERVIPHPASQNSSNDPNIFYFICLFCNGLLHEHWGII